MPLRSLTKGLIRRLAADRCDNLPAAIVIADRTALFGQGRQGLGLLRGYLRFDALVAKRQGRFRPKTDLGSKSSERQV